MTLREAIDARHSVRRYLEKPIEPEKKEALQQEIDRCNAESGLHIQLITDEPEAFTGALARYGHFSGVSNYIALVGKKSKTLGEQAGYFGERVVLLAQQLGLNTCWVALTFSKRKCKAVIEKGEKLALVIALGYGATQGKARPTKAAADVADLTGAPDWFLAGVEAALKAPTAVNQQKFRFLRSGDDVQIEATGGVYSDVDLGIVKYHFEIGAGRKPQ
ncbi:MAG: nitroreductase [Clostridia bacterium]|nr:nitroreductase [Clostridia bacterium]